MFIKALDDSSDDALLTIYSHSGQVQYFLSETTQEEDVNDLTWM